MRVTITKVMIRQTQTSSSPRWFVEIRREGDRCIHDDSNYDNEADAVARKSKLDHRHG